MPASFFSLVVTKSVMFFVFFFFFNDPATPEIYPLSLHDALPIWSSSRRPARPEASRGRARARHRRERVADGACTHDPARAATLIEPSGMLRGRPGGARRIVEIGRAHV